MGCQDKARSWLGGRQPMRDLSREFSHGSACQGQARQRVPKSAWLGGWHDSSKAVGKEQKHGKGCEGCVCVEKSL